MKICVFNWIKEEKYNKERFIFWFYVDTMDNLFATMYNSRSQKENFSKQKKKSNSEKKKQINNKKLNK